MSDQEDPELGECARCFRPFSNGDHVYLVRDEHITVRGENVVTSYYDVLECEDCHDAC